MTNALNALRLRWRARQENLSRLAGASPSGVEREHLKHEWTVLNGCIQELLDTVAGVRPLPLNEASTQKLYSWAPRMIADHGPHDRGPQAQGGDNNNDLASSPTSSASWPTRSSSMNYTTFSSNLRTGGPNEPGRNGS